MTTQGLTTPPCGVQYVSGCQHSYPLPPERHSSLVCKEWAFFSYPHSFQTPGTYVHQRLPLYNSFSSGLLRDVPMKRVSVEEGLGCTTHVQNRDMPLHEVPQGTMQTLVHEEKAKGQLMYNGVEGKILATA